MPSDVTTAVVAPRRYQTTNRTEGQAIMDMKLEVVVLPVADVDRAKTFYKTLGFREDID